MKEMIEHHMANGIHLPEGDLDRMRPADVECAIDFQPLIPQPAQVPGGVARNHDQEV